MKSPIHTTFTPETLTDPRNAISSEPPSSNTVRSSRSGDTPMHIPADTCRCFTCRTPSCTTWTIPYYGQLMCRHYDSISKDDDYVR